MPSLSQRDEQTKTPFGRARWNEGVQLVLGELADRQELRLVFARHAGAQRLAGGRVPGGVADDQDAHRQATFASLDGAADQEFDVLEVVQPRDRGEDQQLGALDERPDALIAQRARRRGRRYGGPYRADASLVDAPAHQVLALQPRVLEHEHAPVRPHPVQAQLLVLEQVQRLGRVAERPRRLVGREHVHEVVDERAVVGHAAGEFRRVEFQQGVRLVIEHGLVAESVCDAQQLRSGGDGAAHRVRAHVEVETECGAAQTRSVYEVDARL